METINQHIALILKTLRRKRGWSLERTAQETGVSKAMLGQIERGESSPTMATLWKIATGFNTSFSSFLEDFPHETQQPIHRSGQTQSLHPADDKIRITPLFPYDEQLNCEIFIIELLPGCEHLSEPHQFGVIEHVIVAEGTMEVLVNGKWHSLHESEGLRFAADQPHGYRNYGNQTSRFHNVIHYQKQTQE